MPYWFNVSTGQVETDETRGHGEDVLGPYATQEEASRALEIAAERTKQWDRETEAWEDYGDKPSGR